jgi:hypothetical protein
VSDGNDGFKAANNLTELANDTMRSLSETTGTSYWSSVRHVAIRTIGAMKDEIERLQKQLDAILDMPDRIPDSERLVITGAKEKAGD